MKSTPPAIREITESECSPCSAMLAPQTGGAVRTNKPGPQEWQPRGGSPAYAALQKPATLPCLPDTMLLEDSKHCASSSQVQSLAILPGLRGPL